MSPHLPHQSPYRHGFCGDSHRVEAVEAVEAVLSLHAAVEAEEASCRQEVGEVAASCRQEVGEVAASYHQVAAGEEASCRRAYHALAEEAAEKCRFR